MLVCLIVLGLFQVPLLAVTSDSRFLDVSINRYSSWQLSSSSVRNWADISSSADGKYVYSVSSGYGIHRSTNYGVSFARVTTSTLNWNAISSNAVGDKVVANDYLNGIYISNDYGTTWTSANLLVNTGFLVEIATSSSGQYIFIASTNTTSSNGFYYSSNYGSSFTSSNVDLMSGSVCCSSDGQYVLVSREDGKVSVSSDFGATFTSHSAVSNSVSGITCSSSAEKCALISKNEVYVTVDYGSTWTQSSLTTTTNTASHHDYTDIVMSYTGQYLTVSVFNEYVYQSSDYGATWSQSTNFIAPWGPIASDSSGLNLVVGTSASGNLFYLHTNSAVGGVAPSAAPTTAAAPAVSVVPGRWNYSTNLPYAQYSAVAFSSSGQFVTVSATTTNYLTSYPIQGVYTSSDYGTTFTAASINSVTYNSDGTGATQWTDVQISSTGGFLLASELNNGIFLSSDSGATFDPLYSPSNCYTFQLAASDDFIYMFAIVVDLSSSKEYWHRSIDGGDTWTSQEGSNTPVSSYITFSTLSCSSSGQYVAIAQSHTAKLYVSSTYGSFYLQPSSQSASYTWSDVSMSASGQIIYVVSTDSNSAVLVSSDYGSTFTSSQTFSDVSSITCNYAGNLLTLVTSTGSVYHSVDSGRSWVLQLAQPEVQFSAVGTNYISNNLAAVGSPGFGYFLTNNSIASLSPTRKPSVFPSRSPSLLPSRTPSRPPSLRPSVLPTRTPSLTPSALPSTEPSAAPYATDLPTAAPTDRPTTVRPSFRPTIEPSLIPSRIPTSTPPPTTLSPTQPPTTTVPTRDPASTQIPTEEPTLRPSRQPTSMPTFILPVAPNGQSTRTKHTDSTGIIIGVVIAGMMIMTVCIFFTFRILSKRARHNRVYAAPPSQQQLQPSPQFGDDDYIAPVIDDRNNYNLDVEAQFEEEVQRRLNELDRDHQLLLSDVEDTNHMNNEVEEEEEQEEEDPEEEVNVAFPLAHIENNPDGSVRETVVVMAQWASPPTSTGGVTAQHHVHQHLPTDTGDLVEVDEDGAMGEGVVFVPDNYVVMVDATPV